MSHVPFLLPRSPVPLQSWAVGNILRRSPRSDGIVSWNKVNDKNRPVEDNLSLLPATEACLVEMLWQHCCGSEEVITGAGNAMSVQFLVLPAAN